MRPLTEQDKAEIWDLVATGAPLARVAREVHRGTAVVYGLVSSTGGVRPPKRVRAAVHLTVEEREDIAAGLAAVLSVRRIAAGLGRAPSTISRELRRNGGHRRYRPSGADRAAWQRARRPKVWKLEANSALRELVQARLELQWSPQQIAGWLKVEFPHDPELRVSHETIYLSLFVQSKGLLRKELTRELRTGRAIRRAARSSVRGNGKGQNIGMVHISERPAEAEDRAVPGHWEGDMFSGSNNSHIATLVERSSRFVMLVKLPNKTADVVATALASSVQEPPEQLRRSLTWDRGHEMAQHQRFTVDTGVQVYFCDPKSPWQRGTNENTNGLLRQYFPARTSLHEVTQQQLDEVAMRLNTRPRKTLGFMTPSAKLSELLR